MVVSFTVQTIEKAEKQISVTFFLQPDLPDYKSAIIKAQLMKMQKNNQIHSYQYHTEQETLEMFAKTQPDRFLFLQNNLSSDIPISPSFSVVPQSQNLEILIEYFLQSEFSDSIDTERLQRSSEAIIQSKRSLEFLEFLKIGIIGIILLVVMGISIITASFIASVFHSKRNEVFIMRLVGASAGFIRTPFLLESFFFTFLSLLLGWGAFFALRYVALNEMMSLFSSREEMIAMALTLNSMWAEFLGYIPFILGGIFILIFISSYLTLETLLRKRDILATS